VKNVPVADELFQEDLEPPDRCAPALQVESKFSTLAAADRAQYIVDSFGAHARKPSEEPKTVRRKLDAPVIGPSEPTVSDFEATAGVATGARRITLRNNAGVLLRVESGLGLERSQR